MIHLIFRLFSFHHLVSPKLLSALCTFKGIGRSLKWWIVNFLNHFLLLIKIVFAWLKDSHCQILQEFCKDSNASLDIYGFWERHLIQYFSGINNDNRSTSEWKQQKYSVCVVNEDLPSAFDSWGDLVGKMSLGNVCLAEAFRMCSRWGSSCEIFKNFVPFSNLLNGLFV